MNCVVPLLCSASVPLVSAVWTKPDDVDALIVAVIIKPVLLALQRLQRLVEPKKRYMLPTQRLRVQLLWFDQ